MRLFTALAAVAALALPAAAQAVQFRLTYTTQVDATSGPAATLDALLTTDDGSFYGGNGYRVLSATGTRTVQAVAQAVSFDSATLNDEIYFPSNADGDYVDSFGLDLVAGGVTYNLYKNGRGDFAYHENDGVTGRLIAPAAISLTRVTAPAPVPEPATWAMMLAGFGLVGLSVRRRSLAVA